MRIVQAVTLFFLQDVSQLFDVLDRERWDVCLDELEAVNVFVCFFFRQDRGLVEATKSVYELLERFLVTAAIAIVLGFAEPL